jgi:predicted dehydrogenase
LKRLSPFKGRAADVDVVSDLMIHDLDLLHFLFQKRPISVEARGYCLVTSLWDHVEATFICATGDMVWIEASRAHLDEERSLTVTSALGQWKVDLLRQTFRGSFPSKDTGEFQMVEKVFHKRDHLLLEQEQFFLSIHQQRPSIVPFEEAKRVAYWMDCLREAIRTQKPQVIHEQYPLGVVLS